MITKPKQNQMSERDQFMMDQWKIQYPDGNIPLDEVEMYFNPTPLWYLKTFYYWDIIRGAAIHRRTGKVQDSTHISIPVRGISPVTRRRGEYMIRTGVEPYRMGTEEASGRRWVMLEKGGERIYE